MCATPLPAAAQQPQPSPPAAAPQQFQQSQEWSKLPKMVLERQFSGPLQDTVIQRLRDPVDGFLTIGLNGSQRARSGLTQVLDSRGISYEEPACPNSSTC
jgi:hypothetical protein